MCSLNASSTENTWSFSMLFWLLQSSEKKKGSPVLPKKLTEPDTKTQKRQHNKKKLQTNHTFCILNPKIINKYQQTELSYMLKHAIHHDQERVMAVWGMQELFNVMCHQVNKPKGKKTQNLERSSEGTWKKNSISIPNRNF